MIGSCEYRLKVICIHMLTYLGCLGYMFTEIVTKWTQSRAGDRRKGITVSIMSNRGCAHCDPWELRSLNKPHPPSCPTRPRTLPGVAPREARWSCGAAGDRPRSRPEAGHPERAIRAMARSLKVANRHFRWRVWVLLDSGQQLRHLGGQYRCTAAPRSTFSASESCWPPDNSRVDSITKYGPEPEPNQTARANRNLSCHSKGRSSSCVGR